MLRMGPDLVLDSDQRAAPSSRLAQGDTRPLLVVKDAVVGDGARPLPDSAAGKVDALVERRGCEAVSRDRHGWKRLPAVGDRIVSFDVRKDAVALYPLCQAHLVDLTGPSDKGA